MRDEQVLVVPRSKMFPDGTWYGLLHEGVDEYCRIIRQEAVFRPRQEVENDPGYQQVIPYAVFRCGNRYLLTHRLRRSTEPRLRKLYSLGIGGHINPSDAVDADPVVGGLEREWKEEVDYPHPLNLTLLGLLKDDSAPVSQVHLGVVFLADGESPEICIKEVHKLDGELLSLDEMTIFYLDMESWSQVIYDHLRQLEASTKVIP